MKTTLIIGVILIALGILFLGPSLNIFSLTVMWPAILLLIGIGFFMAYFAAPKLYGLLMPASVLVLFSIPFFMCTFSGDWRQMDRLWPLFVLAVAVGFLFMYFLGGKQRGLMVTGLILVGFSAVSYVIVSYIKLVFPILFIVGGLVMVYMGLVAQKKAKSAA